MSAFETIAKILALEQKLGCKNTSVIGGLETYLANWPQQNQPKNDPVQNERQYPTLDLYPAEAVKTTHAND